MVKIRVKQSFIHLSSCRTPVEQRDTRIDSRDAKALTTLLHFRHDIIAYLSILE